MKKKLKFVLIILSIMAPLSAQKATANDCYPLGKKKKKADCTYQATDGTPVKCVLASDYQLQSDKKGKTNSTDAGACGYKSGNMLFACADRKYISAKCSE